MQPPRRPHPAHHSLLPFRACRHVHSCVHSFFPRHSSLPPSLSFLFSSQHSHSWLRATSDGEPHQTRTGKSACATGSRKLLTTAPQPYASPPSPVAPEQ